MDLGAAIAGGEQPICRRHISLKDCPSLTPPAHGYPDNAGEQPSFVLIEPYAYFADRCQSRPSRDCADDAPHVPVSAGYCCSPPPYPPNQVRANGGEPVVPGGLAGSRPHYYQNPIRDELVNTWDMTYFLH